MQHFPNENGKLVRIISCVWWLKLTNKVSPIHHQKVSENKCKHIEMECCEDQTCKDANEKNKF